MTTINLQVGNDADDGIRFNGSFFTGLFLKIGRDAGGIYKTFYRWTAATFGGTIDAAIIQLYGQQAGSGTALMKAYVVKEDNAAAPTSAAEFDADPLTAGIDWDEAFDGDAFNPSPELKTIFQELVDAHTISNDAVMAQVNDDGGASGNYNVPQQHASDPAEAAKLDIDYTGAGAPARRIFITHG